MQVSVTFRNMEPKELLRDYAQAKISKLERFLDHPLEAKAVLAREKHRQRAEVTLPAHGINLNAHEETEDMFAAIDLVTEKLERQILKKKGKVKRPRFISTHPQLNWRIAAIAMEGSDERPESKIITKKRLRIEPMSVVRAALQMDLLNDDFLVFTNAATKGLNIIYRCEDGLYGLIEA